MKKYKAPKGKKQTVNEYIENSFKQNAEIIRPALAEYMGNTVPDSNALEIYTATVLDKLENKKLTTMVLEIDITKCNKSIREIMKLIQALEGQELTDNDLEVKDIYFK